MGSSGKRAGGQGPRTAPAALLLLLLGSCQGGQTDFLQRTAEDCRAGDAGACELLSDLRPNIINSGAGGPSKPNAPPLSPVARDVEAIVEGIRRARGTPRPPPPEQPSPALAKPPAPDQPASP